MRGGSIEPREVHLLPSLQSSRDPHQSYWDSYRVDMSELQPIFGGVLMAGTPRSYALDPDVVRFLDSLPDGRKRPNPWSSRHYASSRSKTVSQAVRAYYLTDQFDYQKELLKNIEGLQEVIKRLHKELDEIKQKKSLWGRLKARLGR
jgi:hypothetical protein